MELNFHKMKTTKLLFLLLFSALIPYVSSSVRVPYIYLLINSIIIALCYESGVLQFSSKQGRERRMSPISNGNAYVISDGFKQAIVDSGFEERMATSEENSVKPEKLQRQKSSPKVKKSSSGPSLFFISSCYGDGSEAEEEEELQESKEESSKQELLTRADSFIKNFYRQLKIQREESFKAIYGICNKPV
ncbi:uncharacterized protein LOC144709874 [Wolffia australiana]